MFPKTGFWQHFFPEGLYGHSEKHLLECSVAERHSGEGIHGHNGTARQAQFLKDEGTESWKHASLEWFDLSMTETEKRRLR